MRQVPSYLIIGDGRMASHFTEYLRLLALPYQTWSRKKNSPAELSQALKQHSRILLLIRDSAIYEFAKTLPRSNKSQLFIHFSGSLTLLEHAGIYSAHPLMTFGQTLYDLERYKSIPFILETNSPSLATLLPGLANREFSIPCSQKPYYHALCVMSSNFTAILWNKIFSELEKTLNIPPDIAIPYLEQTCANLIQSPQAALTGPLIRNDVKTIEANLAALASKSDPFQLIYHAFYEAYHRSQHEYS